MMSKGRAELGLALSRFAISWREHSKSLQAEQDLYLHGLLPVTIVTFLAILFWASPGPLVFGF